MCVWNRISFGVETYKKHLSWNPFLVKLQTYVYIYEKASIAGVFRGILRHFSEKIFTRAPVNNCFFFDKTVRYSNV